MIRLKLKSSDTLKKKIENALNVDNNLVIDKIIKDTVQDLSTVTPKDTGYAASRWNSYKTEKLTFDISIKNRFFIDIRKESVYFIENDAEYITYLNAGSSKQAPAYFVEQTIIQNGFVPTFTR